MDIRHVREGNSVQRPGQRWNRKRKASHAEMVELRQGHASQTDGEQRRGQRGAGADELHRPERLYILVGAALGWKLGQMPKTFSPESYYCAKKEQVAQDLFDFWRSQGEAPKLARIPDPIEPGPDTVGRDVMPKCGPGVKPPCA